MNHRFLAGGLQSLTHISLKPVQVLIINKQSAEGWKRLPFPGTALISDNITTKTKRATILKRKRGQPSADPLAAGVWGRTLVICQWPAVWLSLRSGLGTNTFPPSLPPVKLDFLKRVWTRSCCSGVAIIRFSDLFHVGFCNYRNQRAINNGAGIDCVCYELFNCVPVHVHALVCVCAANLLERVTNWSFSLSDL